MLKRLTTILFLIVIFGVVVYFYLGANIEPGNTPLEELTDSDMKITSTAFTNNQMIPSKYTCDGLDISPPLEFSEIPEGAKSLALIVDDPDAPMGTWVHWVVFNIPSETESIQEDALPEGAVLGTTDFGDNQYGGPCPPSGTHRYFFKLYALDKEVSLPEGSSKKDLLEDIEENVLGYSELIGLYKR